METEHEILLSEGQLCRKLKTLDLKHVDLPLDVAEVAIQVYTTLLQHWNATYQGAYGDQGYLTPFDSSDNQC